MSLPPAPCRRGRVTVVAPIAGTVLRRQAQVRQHAAVSLRFPDLPDPVPVRVVGVGALVDVGQRRAPVYITLDPEAARTTTLTPGMFVRANISSPATTGVTLPKQAVPIRGGDKSTAYVEIGPGEFEARDVVVGHSAGDRTQVVSGIAPGERVVVSGALLLDQQAKLRDMLDGSCPRGHAHQDMSLATNGRRRAQPGSDRGAAPTPS